MSFRDYSPQRGPELDGRKRRSPVPPPRRLASENSPLRRTSSSSNNNNGLPVHSPQYQQTGLQFNRSQSDSHEYHQQQQQQLSAFASTQSHVVQQREEEYALQVMQQREEELRDIHRKMHVVNEIYKDLGEVVDQQQEHIDNLEDQFSGAAEATRRGLEQIEKANSKSRRKGADGEQDEGEGKRKQFFLFRYLTKSANEITKLVSACGGHGSASYVNDGDGWNKNKGDR